MKHKPKLSIVQPEPLAKDLIERLEGLLEQAKSGELSSICCALVYRDGCTGHNRSYLPSTSLALGALERLKHSILMKEYE